MLAEGAANENDRAEKDGETDHRPKGEWIAELDRRRSIARVTFGMGSQ